MSLFNSLLLGTYISYLVTINLHVCNLYECLHWTSRNENNSGVYLRFDRRTYVAR